MLLEHFTARSFSRTNLICSVFKEQSVQEDYTMQTHVLLRKKAIHLHPTHWTIALRIP
jgi:hypothetical protein